MNSRMNKYYEEETTNSRYRRNEELYKRISTNELSNFDIKSNATVLGENDNSIDIEKIKKILDTKYNEIPKRKSIRLEEEPVKEIEKEITKEYDINVILEKAHEEKKDNYDEERFKKLRDTQYDILNNLDIKESEKEEKEDLTEDDDLKTLIDTIAYNETKNSSDNVDSALDVLSELKGEDNTEILEGLKEQVEREEEKEDLTSTKMINSFYTSSNALQEKDFEDIDDFTKSVESNGVFLKIIIAIIVIAVIIGVVLLVKTIYF